MSKKVIISTIILIFTIGCTALFFLFTQPAVSPLHSQLQTQLQRLIHAEPSTQSSITHPTTTPIENTAATPSATSIDESTPVDKNPDFENQSNPNQSDANSPDSTQHAPSSIDQQPVKALTGVKLITERDWISADGLYFLNLYTGKWNPNGTLFYLTKRGGVSFEGFQKGLEIKLKSFNPELSYEATPEYQIQGTLDITQNRFLATMINHYENTTRKVTFKPAIPVDHRPLLNFKFYGVEDHEQYRAWITKIEVIDKRNQDAVKQTLTGFKANDYAVYYADLDYDGYFDLILDVGERVEDDVMLFFRYDPTQQQFVKSTQWDHLDGQPTRYPQKQQLNFGQGILYQKMPDGQWKQVPCCYAD